MIFVWHRLELFGYNIDRLVSLYGLHFLLLLHPTPCTPEQPLVAVYAALSCEGVSIPFPLTVCAFGSVRHWLGVVYRFHLRYIMD